jgi:hypothetical protein
MNYELAKQLKDAGYPQPIIVRTCGHSYWIAESKNGREQERCYVPTLSELIEACGHPIVLHSPGSTDINEGYYMPSKNLWSAFQGWEKTAFGNTPEEAVAHLWLALNSTK